MLLSRPPWWVCGGGIDARHLPISASSINRKQSKTVGLRDALGRHAGTLQNLASIESSKPTRGRLYLALTGTTAHTHLFTAYFVI